MKLWYGYGSEHSMNLVMVGRFQDAAKARNVESSLDKLRAQVYAELGTYSHDAPLREQRYSDAMLELLRDLNISIIRPGELEQFVFDVNVKLVGSEIRLRTDEADISAYMKLFIEEGARIEIYSAHDFSEESVEDHE